MLQGMCMHVTCWGCVPRTGDTCQMVGMLPPHPGDTQKLSWGHTEAILGVWHIPRTVHVPVMHPGRIHAALWQALYVIMHPALILAGTINLDKSSHDFFHSHCH